MFFSTVLRAQLDSWKDQSEKEESNVVGLQWWQSQGGSTASRGMEIDQVEPTRCKKGRRRRTHVQQPPSGQEIAHLGFGAKVAQALGVSYADAAVYSPFRRLANLGVVTNTYTHKHSDTWRHFKNLNVLVTFFLY